MGKRDALAAFLDREVERPHGWGVADCHLSPADWVRTATGRDPAAAWRRRYRSLSGAARLTRAAGGSEALWRAAAASVGLVIANPVCGGRILAGDVGLVRTACAPDTPRILGDLVGAICIGGGQWAVKSTAGLVMDAFPVVLAWRVEWRTR